MVGLVVRDQRPALEKTPSRENLLVRGPLAKHSYNARTSAPEPLGTERAKQKRSIMYDLCSIETIVSVGALDA
jgi:hypothetical protein